MCPKTCETKVKTLKGLLISILFPTAKNGMSVSPLNLLSKKTPAQMRENPKITGELNFTFLITFLEIKVYKSDFLRCI